MAGARPQRNCTLSKGDGHYRLIFEEEKISKVERSLTVSSTMENVYEVEKIVEVKKMKVSPATTDMIFYYATRSSS